MVYFFIEERFDVLEFCSIKYKQKERERLCQYLDAFLLEMFFLWDLALTKDAWTDVVRDKTVGLSRKCSLDCVEQVM